MKRLAFAVPGDLRTPTGGYAYDRRVIDELRALGWQVQICDLGGGYPRPGAAGIADAATMLGGIESAVPVVIDGLALGVLPDLAEELSRSKKLIALVHHPLAWESGLSAEEAHALRASERRSLSYSLHVIVTSPSTARLLVAEYGIAAGHITVARPGTDPVPFARGSAGSGVAMLAVGAIVPRKGYDVLLEALERLCDLDWSLTVAGDPNRAPAYAARIRAQADSLALRQRVAFAGAVPENELASLYDRADLFVLASRYEGYGMAFAEAIAYGLPVVACESGAVRETLPQPACRFVPADDADALAGVLRELVAAPAARHKLRAAARAAAASLPTWRDCARIFARAIEEVA